MRERFQPGNRFPYNNGRMLLEGIFSPITTPFYHDGALYLRKLEHNVALYSRTQLAGMLVLGSTGEAIMLSNEEQREVLATAIAVAAPDKVMIAGVGQESVRQTLLMVDAAASLDYDAVLVRTPHFYRRQLHRTDGPSLEMLTYYRTVADHSALPVVIYNVPNFTGYDMPVDLIAELAHHPNIIGIKESSGAVGRVAALVDATKSVKRTATVTTTFSAVTHRMLSSQPPDSAPRFVMADALQQGNSALAVAAPPSRIKTREKEIGFAVLTGGASAMHEAFRQGASGAVIAFATCAPQCCCEIWMAWKEGDEALAAEKQERICAASSIVGGQMGVPGLKFACDLNGYYGGRARLPLLPLNADQQQQVTRLMADIRY
ncbi:MAG: dihydrodipicolinate synthase family protein [Acidobacteriaceae bacterium]